ncbi:Pumilio domain-containing protein 5, partial [Bienertia sinuspersici]
YWTYEEDAALIRYLHELSGNPKWKSKNGYLNKFEELIKSVFPNCGLKATPHIESRIKHWSEKYSAISEMLSISIFGWDAWKKMLQVEKMVFDEWVKTHKKAKGLFGVPVTHIDTLAEIYVKDKAARDTSESFVGAIGDMDQQIENHPLNVESEFVDDVNSTHSNNLFLYKSIWKAPHEIEDNHPTHSKKEKVKDVKEAKVNKVLEVVMKLDGISPSEALEVATIRMAEEHKLRIFYQAPTNMKKQYVIDLLKKK